MSGVREEVSAYRITLIQNEHHNNSIVVEPPLSREQYSRVARAVFPIESDPSADAFNRANSEGSVTRIRTFVSGERLQKRGELAKQALSTFDIEVELIPEITPGY